MFGKGDQTSAGPADPVRDFKLSDAGGSKSVAASASGGASVISTDLKVVGNLESTGDIEIDGTVEGDIKSRNLTIGESAHIKGTMMADTMMIHGTVSGQIKGDMVRISKTANITGDITYATLSIEEGASVEGEVRHADSSRKMESSPRVAAIKTGTEDD